jgi:hypothetical protein
VPARLNSTTGSTATLSPASRSQVVNTTNTSTPAPARSGAASFFAPASALLLMAALLAALL